MLCAVGAVFVLATPSFSPAPRPAICPFLGRTGWRRPPSLGMASEIYRHISRLNALPFSPLTSIPTVSQTAFGNVRPLLPVFGQFPHLFGNNGRLAYPSLLFSATHLPSFPRPSPLIDLSWGKSFRFPWTGTVP